LTDKDIEPVVMFKYVCTPMNRSNYELRSMTIIIYAKDKDNAEKIFMKKAHKFFDQDLHVVKTQLYKGFREKV